MSAEPNTSSYFEPDKRWKLFQLSTLEEYVDKFVVRGKFHRAVPEDIKEAWKTVEYILAHAFYHWPMYDEGFRKALLIIEMGVKLKAKENGVSLKESLNKNGKSFDKKLSKIIKEVFSGENFNHLKEDIICAKDLRNILVHPESNDFMGGVGNIRGNLMFMVNVLNDIFLNEDYHNKAFHRNSQIAESMRRFNNKLLILEYQNPSILIDQILDFKTIGEKLFLFLNPIRKNISEILENHYSIYPEVICLSEYNIANNEIKGIDAENNKIRLFETDKPENIEIQTTYLSKIKRSYEVDWIICVNSLKHNTSWEMVKLAYEDLEESE